MPIWGILRPQAAGEGGARLTGAKGGLAVTAEEGNHGACGGWSEERSQERGSRCPAERGMCDRRGPNASRNHLLRQ